MRGRPVPNGPEVSLPLSNDMGERVESSANAIRATRSPVPLPLTLCGGSDTQLSFGDNPPGKVTP